MQKEERNVDTAATAYQKQDMRLTGVTPTYILKEIIKSELTGPTYMM
jgi:hypothetical protein